MSVVSYGLGRDVDVLGAVVALGFGIFTVTPIPPAYIPIRFENSIGIEVRTVTVPSQECR